MGPVRLTKFEVAEKQLAKAIELFRAHEPLPAITLAGAAEEILGKLVKDGGGVNALEEEVKDRCDLYQTVFGRSADPKVFAEPMNNPRNELKHRMSGNPLELNLEEEAVNLIQRAIDNFQKLRPGPNAMFRQFEDEAAAWYRRFSEQIAYKRFETDSLRRRSSFSLVCKEGGHGTLLHRWKSYGQVFAEPKERRRARASPRGGV